MAETIASGCERRQFRLLLRTSFGRLMDTAVASRDVDATQFVIWSFALIASPAFFFAAKMMGKYSFLWRQPDVLARVVPVDRLFFLVYMMLATALLAAVLWEALFPDRQDQEIVGVLPVRARTVALARLAAAMIVATIFSFAIALPSGFMYSLNVAVAYKSFHIVGWWPPVLIAHVVAVTAAGVFTFAALLTVRGMAVMCLGADAVQRAAAVLQLVTVVLLVESFIFLPGVLSGLASQPLVTSNAQLLPPLWFLALYAEMSGASSIHAGTLALTALAGTAVTLVAAMLVYMLPARWNARRATEAQVKNQAGRSIARAERIASPFLREPAARAVFVFVLSSLARSRRHGLIVATYLGVGISVAGIWLMRTALKGESLALDVPADDLVSIPLVLTFFLVLGLRSAFKVPTDLDANWTFRLAQPRSTRPVVHGVGMAMLAVAVFPVSVGWFFVTATLWDFRSAVGTAVMHAASGVMLVELVLMKCEAVPFTRAHAPATSGVRAGWAVMFAALHFYAFKLEDIQLAALGSARGILLYVGMMLAVVAAARLRRRVTEGRRSLEFEAPIEPATQALNLSRATG
jgi:hypothetical protein